MMFSAFVGVAALLCQAAFGSPLVPRNDSYEERVEAILAATPLIDGHIDLPWLARDYGNSLAPGSNFTFDTSLPYHVDLPRMREGRMGGVFWSVYVTCPANKSDYSDAAYYEAVHETLQQIDFVHRLVNRYPSDLALATTAAGAVEAFEAGKIASMIGAEGLHQVGNSVSAIRVYYDAGVRYITMSHSCNNKFIDGANAPDGEIWGGLSPEGVEVVAEYNRLGMLVDLSHVTANAMRDVLDVAVAPVIFSHSSVFALCNVTRNVPDDVLLQVKENGGVVMVNFYNGYVLCGPGKDPANATVQDVADHVEYIANFIGWEYVGIGSDYDGVDVLPAGLEDVSTYPNLFVELLKRGMTDEQGGLMAGGNILRVWTEVEEVAAELQAENAPVLEDVL